MSFLTLYFINILSDLEIVLHCVTGRDVWLHVDSQAMFFNRNQFLDEVSEAERPFYEKVRI